MEVNPYHIATLRKPNLWRRFWFWALLGWVWREDQWSRGWIITGGR